MFGPTLHLKKLQNGKFVFGPGLHLLPHTIQPSVCSSPLILLIHFANQGWETHVFEYFLEKYCFTTFQAGDWNAPMIYL